MPLSRWFRTGALAAVACLCMPGQNAPSAKTQAETKGMTPRTSASDYQASVQAGAMTIAAEFTGHSVPTLEGPLAAEDYVVIETALFGPPGARATISSTDFSLSINGKKPLPSQPFVLVGATVKDPEWEPPELAIPKKSKTSMSAGGGEGEQRDPNEPPPPVKIPVTVQRGWAQRVQRAALPEGDRPLPQAGLLFFQYRGKDNISSLQLIYAGPAGKATLSFKP